MRLRRAFLLGYRRILNVRGSLTTKGATEGWGWLLKPDLTEGCGFRCLPRVYILGSVLLRMNVTRF